MSDVNKDFDLELGNEIPEMPVGKKNKKPSQTDGVKLIDPEDDRENWPTIIIDAADGMPNYEFVAAHGTKKNGSVFGHELQIMRGVEVQVPPSVVYGLRDTMATHYIQRRDPLTGQNIMIKQERSSIPWRLVKGGKYC